jgi:DNA-binding transcriptional MerR regulator
MSPIKYTLTELAEKSGVTARTIRYYISQGLMDGAIKSGKDSYYLPSHLKRLQVIQVNKEAGDTLEQIKIKLGLVQPTMNTGLSLRRFLVARDIEVNIAVEMSQPRRRKVENALKAFAEAVSETTNDSTKQENDHAID